MANPSPVTDGLRPPWTSETAPKGRKNAGLSINEWRNAMAEYEKDEIESVLGNPRASAAQIIAAKELMQAIGGDRGARQDLCDYTNSLPTRKLDVDVNYVLRTPDDRAAAATEAATRLKSLLHPSAN